MASDYVHDAHVDGVEGIDHQAPRRVGAKLSREHRVGVP
jgi:hypothetical protein